MTPVERLLEKLPNAQQSGNGWSARCPSHEDHRPSLSIAEGNDGRALVKCHAGCSVDAICDAVGLHVAELMAEDAVSSGTIRRRSEIRRVSTAPKTGKTYATAKAAIVTLERKHGDRSAIWTYHDAEGNPVGVIVRWDKPGGKDIRPVARRGNRWIVGGMPEQRPLYRLPELASADRVFIAEGEKAADAARAIGLTATTSAHGSQSPDKSDWSPLAGKECVILPDRDIPGRKYAESVAALLAGLTRPPIIKVVELPGLPDGGDMADWVESRASADMSDLRQQVESLAKEADTFHAGRPETHVERFQPFPTGVLPEPLRGFVIAGSKAIGCDASYLALPMLTALASAIGTTRRIQLKRGWSAPAIIWTAIVGESGTAKTPAFKLVMKTIRERQGKALQRYAESMNDHEVDLACYEKAIAAWKRDKKTDEPPPTKPDPPQAERCIVSDATVEAMAPLLLANPRGLLLARDELSGWIGSFDRYAGGKGGADAAHWLSMHNGESIVVDRKTGTPRTIYVPTAAVSVCGGIQPAILHRALGIEHRESGLAARLLLTCPPRKPKRWTEADIDSETESEIARLFDRLYALQPTVGDDDELQPLVVGLTPDAKAAWKTYFNAHAQEQADLAGDLSAAWSKLEEYAARFALVVHYVRWAAEDPNLDGPDVIDTGSIEAGIDLTNWFKGEARRVYAQLSESGDERNKRELVEWIDRKGGRVTAREVQQGHRRYHSARDAEAALDDVFKAGYGRWENVPTTAKGGRPSRAFRLLGASTVYETIAAPEGNDSCVDVDSVDAPESRYGDDVSEEAEPADRVQVTI